MLGHNARTQTVTVTTPSRISTSHPAPTRPHTSPVIRMALATRASVSVKACAPARAVRPVAVRPMAALNQQQAFKVAGAGLATVALAAAFAAAPAEAHNVISTVASATEGYPFVPPSWAPSVLVPFTGLVLPAIVMASLFVYIEKEA